MVHPQMGLNQHPAQRQKGWGLVRTEPTCDKQKKQHRRTILPKQTRTPPRPLALTESPGIKMTHVMTEGQAKIRNLVKREKATDEELKSPENF